MEFAIDVRTSLMLLTVGNLLTGILLLAHARGGGLDVPLRRYLGAKLLLGVAWYLLALRGLVPDLLSAVAGNLLLLAGNCLEGVALAGTAQPGRNWLPVFVLPACAGALLFLGFGHSPKAWVVIASLMTVPMYALAAAAVLRHPGRTWLHHALALVLAVQAGVLALRGLNPLLADPGATLLKPSILQAVTFIVAFVQMLTSGLALAIMRKEALDLQLAERDRERERTIAALQQALGEIRTLTGMLPICASCKKIRDDQGYWNQLESYLAEHSEASFTHSLCPECRPTYFPERGKAEPAQAGRTQNLGGR